MKNQVFSSVLTGILFAFSALLMWWKKDESVSAILLANSAVLMLVYVALLKNGKTTCTLKSDKNEN